MMRLFIASFFLCHVMGDLGPIEESENQHNISKRIVGGDYVHISQFPYLVSITTEKEDISLVDMCGGSIISKTIVLTAAHCLYHDSKRVPASSFRVRSGSSEDDFGGYQHRVLMGTHHEEYDMNKPIKQQVDLGLLYVTPSFKFGADVKSIPLAETGFGVAPDTVARVIGWGANTRGGPSGFGLRSTRLKIIDSKTCSTFYGQGQEVINIANNICALESGRNACEGDSGGPLVVGSFQIGVVSMGHCNEMGPTISVKVANFREWIDQTSKRMNSLFENESLGAPKRYNNPVPQALYTLMDTVTEAPNQYKAHQPDELRK